MSTSRLPSGPWCVFGASLVSALGTIVTGALAAKQPSFDWALVGFYCCFVLIFGTFVCMCIDNWNALISCRCLYYFSMIVLTIATLATITRIESSALYIYLPISCNIGVYLGLGSEHLRDQFNWTRIRYYLISCLMPQPEQLPQWQSQLTPLHVAPLVARPHTTIAIDSMLSPPSNPNDDISRIDSSAESLLSRTSDTSSLDQDV